MTTAVQDAPLKQNKAADALAQDAERRAAPAVELPGIATPKTKAQKRAQELADALVAKQIIGDRVKKRQEALISQMRAEEVQSIAVHDSAGFVHTFTLDPQTKVKHTALVKREEEDADEDQAE